MSLLFEGSTFGKYRIIRQLGRGGMGVVYLAEDTMLAREIALKILDRAMTSDASFEERFRQEARTIARLKHPNIVQVHALERIEGELAIEMEYVEGGALSEVIVDRAQAIQIIYDTLEALACCHGLGIVHRDVKPSNILISGERRALLTDFGLSKLLSAYHASMMSAISTSALFVGTPRYAPPESWDAQEASARWDVYSMGMILYEEFARKTPYDAETPFALIKQIIERPITPLHEVTEGVSPELSALVSAMLKREPEKRPEDAAQALEQFHKCPEVREALGADRSTVLRKRPVTPVPKRGSVLKTGLPATAAGKKWKFLRLVAAIALCLALTVAAVLRWGYPPLDETSSQVPARSAPAEPFGVYNTIEPARQQIWNDQWLMRPGDKPDEYLVLAAKDTHLWQMRARVIDKDTLSFSGNWAEYTDTTARAFRYGALTGTGRWINSNQDFSLALEFVSSLDGAQQERSYVLKRSPREVSEVAFLRALERSAYFPAILYNELFPRQAPWALEIERCLSAALGPVITVPFIRGDAAAPIIDGRISESFWRVSELESAEAQGLLRSDLPGTPDKMMLRYDTEGLYIGWRIRSAPSRARISLGLMTHYRTPATDSPRWSAQIEEGVITASRHVQRGQGVPWNCNWTAAFSPVGDDTDASAPLWETVIYIPFDGLADTQPARPGERWRVNCHLTDPQSPGREPVIVWGVKNISEVEHGVMLAFGS